MGEGESTHSICHHPPDTLTSPVIAPLLVRSKLYEVVYSPWRNSFSTPGYRFQVPTLPMQGMIPQTFKRK
jgi:hypothetical protein